MDSQVLSWSGSLEESRDSDSGIVVSIRLWQSTKVNRVVECRISRVNSVRLVYSAVEVGVKYPSA